MIHKISEYISEEKLDKRIREIAAQISADYAKKEVRLICILKGSVFYTTELAKRMTVPITMDFMSVSSYGAGTESSGEVKIKKDLDESIEGLDVIVVEDIIDSGYTLSKLIPMLKKRNPASIKDWDIVIPRITKITANKTITFRRTPDMLFFFREICSTIL